MTGVIKSVSNILSEVDAVLASGQGVATITPDRMRQLEEDVVVSVANMALTNVGPGSLQAIIFAPVTGYVFGTKVSSAPVTLAAYFGTLAAAQAVYSFATSLTNYVDRCIVQAALNACTAAGGGMVTLPHATLYIDVSLTWQADFTTLAGSPGPLGSRTQIRTQTCATSPAVSFTTSSGSLNANTAMQDIDFVAANSGITIFPQSGSGVANTGYQSGTVAMQITNCVEGYGAQRCAFYNYDITYVWTAGTGEFSVTFKDCYHVSCNLGVNIGTISTATSALAIEAIRWEGGASTNCNYGYVFNIGAGSGSIYVSDMQIDYNIVRAVYYDGLGGGNDCQVPLFMSGCHLESNGTTSGYTAPMVLNAGNLFMTNCNGYWNDGTNSAGWIESGFYGRTNLADCMVPGTNSQMPVVYNSGSISGFVGASVLSCRYLAQDIQLLSTADGVVMYSDWPQPNVISGTTTLALTNQVRINVCTGSTASNITVPPDSTASHAIGSLLRFITEGTAVWTLVQGAGVTITSVGAGLTFGGAAGKVVGLFKTAANTWLALGDMI